MPFRALDVDAIKVITPCQQKNLSQKNRLDFPQTFFGIIRLQKGIGVVPGPLGLDHLQEDPCLGTEQYKIPLAMAH